MANGIRVTQEGVSVDQAAEYQMILHEQFPYLEFDFVGEVKASGSVSSNTFVKMYMHTLPHIPQFFCFPIKTDGTYDRDDTGYLATSDSIGFIAWSGETYNKRWLLMVIKQDLTQTISAPKGGSIVQATTGPQRKGVAVLKEGANDDIESKDKSNFSLHTNARSFAIHMCGKKTVDSSTSNLLVLNHDLGYPPTFFVARRQVESGSANPLLGQTTQNAFVRNAALATANSATITLRGAQAALNGEYTYLILKDPVDTAS